MALTSGFKKFIGLIVVVGVVGGGAYYWHQKQLTASTQKVQAVEPQPDFSVVQKSRPTQVQEIQIQQEPSQPSQKVVPIQPQVVQQPVAPQVKEAAPVPNFESQQANKGLQYLLNQGKK